MNVQKAKGTINFVPLALHLTYKCSLEISISEASIALFKKVSRFRQLSGTTTLVNIQVPWLSSYI